LTDFDTRAERDRGLFGEDTSEQLVKTLSAANPRIVAGVVRKALDWQIAMEEYARDKGIDFDGDDFLRYKRDNHDELDRHLDRAIMSFIGAIVSQEG